MDNQYAPRPQVPRPTPTPAPQQFSLPPKSVPPQKSPNLLLPVIIISIVVLVAAAVPIFVQSSAAKEQQKRQDTTNEALKAMQSSIEPASSYKSTVKTDLYQAVFLKGGQVYFGKITKLDTAFVTLEDIYYLRTGQDVQGAASTSTDVSLAKLGSELHGPEDIMTIATSDLSFWENLKSEGQVSKAIAEYKKSATP